MARSRGKAPDQPVKTEPDQECQDVCEASSNPIADDRARHFPESIVLAAQHAERETGCPTCVTLAQWAEESSYGAVVPAANNPFGMKWYQGCPYPYRVARTKEWTGQHYVTIEARWIVFPDEHAAFTEHGRLLMDPHGPYATAVPFAHDWVKFVQRVAQVYATDPHYQAHLMNLVEQYRLFDWNLPQVPQGS